MALLSLPGVLWCRLVLISQGIAALAVLTGEALAALPGKGGSAGTRIGAVLTTPSGQRHVFAVLRLFQPNLVLRRKLVTAYENEGTALITRREDVTDVLTRDDDFGVVYQPRMAMITGGDNFFLGMQDTPRYTRDTSNMRLVVRREDVPARILPFVTQTAAELVDRAEGKIDVPQMLTIPVAARLLDHYFGTPGPSEAEIVDWTTTLFWYLFIDLKGEPALDKKAELVASRFRDWMDDHIAARKTSGSTGDDVLGRCLALQSSGTPGMSDRDIRNNLIGLLIGELPTTSAAVNLALAELFERPHALAAAQAAARSGDDERLADLVFESLRFRPLNPVIYRRALRDTTVAGGTLRSRNIAKGTLVMAANLSAMFDPLKVPDAASFRTNRPWETYILWGYGMHRCFGAHINRAVIPAILKPLLARSQLRSSGAGIDTDGTPFPVHFEVEFLDG